MFLGLRTPEGELLLPLTALQILWINFLGDGPPALALAADRSPGVMKHGPRPPQSPLLDGSSLRFILIDGLFKGVVGLALLVAMPAFGVGLAATATSVFLYESVAKLVSAYPARKIGALPSLNPWLHLAVGGGLLLGLLCIVFPPFRAALALSELDAVALAFVAAALVTTWISGETLVRALRAKPPTQDLRPRPA